MTTKDERYDPGINIYGDDDNDDEMNNAKVSPGPGSSPSAHDDIGSVFVYNDIRQGGPLSENGATASPNGGGKKKAQNRKCTACEKTTGDLFDNSRYKCKESDPESDEHHFCYDCAFKPTQCPHCRDQGLRNKDADEYMPKLITDDGNKTCTGCKSPDVTNLYNNKRYKCWVSKPSLVQEKNHRFCYRCAFICDQCPAAVGCAHRDVFDKGLDKYMPNKSTPSK